MISKSLSNSHDSPLTKPEIRRTMLRPTMGAEENRADLLPGTLDMLVPKVLMTGHLHGDAIAQLIPRRACLRSTRARRQGARQGECSAI